MTLSTKNLIIIAGPSASGKSYLIRKLLNDKNQNLMLKIMPELHTSSKLTIGKINLERLTNKIKIQKRSKKMRKDIHVVHFENQYQTYVLTDTKHSTYENRLQRIGCLQVFVLCHRSSLKHVHKFLQEYCAMQGELHGI